MAKLKTSTITGDLSVSGNINGKINASELNRGTVPRERLNVGTTSVTGIVQLNDSVSSTSTTQAATANAVKKANDNANGRFPTSGGTLTGILAMQNGKAIRGSKVDGTALDLALINSANENIIGNTSVLTRLASSSNPYVRIGSANHLLYHQGYKPTPADIGASPSNHNHDNVYLGKNANAVSSSKLVTPRTINGTNFDGTANITTTNWGNSRTITLGGDLTGSVSINGGANVTLNAEVKDNSHNHSSIRGLHGGSVIVNDHGNGNVTIAGAKSSEGVVGDLYLGYNSGSHFSKDVLLCRTMKWQANGSVIVNSEGKIPWGSLTGLPSSFAPSAHTHDDRYLRLTGGSVNGNISVSGDITITAGGKNFIAPNNYGYMGKDTAGTSQYMLYMNTDNQVNVGHANRQVKIDCDNPTQRSGHRMYHQGYKPTPGDIGAVKQSVLGANVNLNSITAPGEYEQNANVNTSTALNYPEALAGHLTVTTGAGTQQRYHVYDTTRIYTRSVYSNGSWTAWAQQYNSSNRPSPAQLGAAGISGGKHIFCQTGQPSATATGDVWISW